MTSVNETESRNIVIVGGGIIGCTTAYYISHHPKFSSSSSTLTLIEASAHGVAQGASGKAGGLVAKWAYPKELVDISFAEHVRLAERHDGTSRWGWRFVGCGSWEGKGEPLQGKDGNLGTGVGKGGERKSLEKTLGLEETTSPGYAASSSARKAKGLPDDLTWVNESLTDSYSSMAPNGSTAQVHPYLFTTSMLELAKEKGAVFISGKVISINRSGGKITGVSYSPSTTQDISTIPATEIIVCAGAWSPDLIPTLPISGTRAHSVVIRPPSESTIAPYVLFTEITLSSNQVVTPEIYARPDGEVYACGPGDDSPLPPIVDDVEVDHAACQSIRDHVASISQELKHGTVNKRQACFLPVVTSGGGPIIGSADKIAKGLFIATGHTCWGICNAPGTAKAMSELLFEGRIRCANLKKLEPSKFL